VDYESYKQVRDKLIREKRLLRLDCMNPVRALSAWSEFTYSPEGWAEASVEETLNAWSSATRVWLAPERTIVGRGIRDLLSAVFSVGMGPFEELWLPKDVYPVYWQLAKNSGAATKGFITLPHPDWGFLDQTVERATLLLPEPISPLGRPLAHDEVELLVRWLRGSKERLLILDAVYTFNFEMSRLFIDQLLEEFSEQCTVIWSCSKSWLSPGLFGVAVVPEFVAPLVRSAVVQPPGKDLGKIRSLLEAHPNLGLLQRDLFAKEWFRLSPQIRQADPLWQPPSTSYFSTVAVPFARLVEDWSILGVPASVFGSTRRDLSVVSCLHDLSASNAAAVGALTQSPGPTPPAPS